MSSFAAPTPIIALELGWSIIPTGLDKRPYFKLLPKGQNGKALWKPYQKRQPNPEEFESWLRAKPPGFAIVTVTISERVTFDFDGHSGLKLAEAWGIHPHRKTGGDGRHLDVRHPGIYVPTLNGKQEQELRRLWAGLDVKGDGGYAIAFGCSLAGSYQWLRDPEPDAPEAVPVEVWEFLRAHQERQRSQSYIQQATRRARDDIRVDPERLIRMALGQVATGNGRNNSGFHLACQLRDNRYSELETERFMYEYARRCPSTNTKGQPEPYTDLEIQATLRSVFRSAPRDPWKPKSNAR